MNPSYARFWYLKVRVFLNSERTVRSFAWILSGTREKSPIYANKNPAKDFCYRNRFVCPCVHAV
jgi:hypothetical protein